jgi:hypothetical protein
MWLIIRKPETSMPELAGGGDVLGGDVGLGAVRGHPHRAHAEGVGVLELGDRADAGQQQRGEHGPLRFSAAASIHSQSVWLPGP